MMMMMMVGSVADRRLHSQISSHFSVDDVPSVPYIFSLSHADINCNTASAKCIKYIAYCRCSFILNCSMFVAYFKELLLLLLT